MSKSLYLNGSKVDVCINKDGNFYLIHRIKALRNISCDGNSRKKVDEVIIVGIHRNKLDSFLKKGNYEWREE